MTDRNGTRTQGPGGEDAWFDPLAYTGPATASPRGVVYGHEPTQPTPIDPYRRLRSIDDDSGWPLEDPRIPHATPPRSRIPPFLVGALVGIILAGVSILGFQLFSRTDDTSAATTPTVPEAAAPVVTTVASATSSSTTIATPTSTLPPAPTTVPEIVPVGVSLPIADLRLSSGGIGPIDFGEPADQALGKLAASLGPPDSDTGLVSATGEYGACVGTPERIVRWGPLAAIVTADETQQQVFSAYRLNLGFGGLESKAAAITTLSGLRAGDTIGTLESIYASFYIEYLEFDDIGLAFELRRTEGEQLLLRGPVTAADDTGRVTGIYSPDACPEA